MKRYLLLILIALLAALPLHAQEATSTPPPGLDEFSSGDNFLTRVRVDSLHVRRLPSADAESVAGLVKGDIVQVVSRNQDASWFEVRRLGRMTNLGWVDNTLIEWDFAPELPPLGDFSVGVIGPKPLTSAPPYGVFLEEAPILRDLPLRIGNRIIVIPALIVVPVQGRNADGTWLQVNYFGYEGWIHRGAIRERRDIDLMTLPVPFGTPPPDTIPVVVIPIEIQQAQIDRLRAFAFQRRTLAAGLEAFWWGVYRGEIMPCNIPPEVAGYPYSDSDIRELPELSRYIPRLTEAVEYLKAARAPFERCGIVAPSVTVDARNSAINARVIFDATLETLDNLEDTLRETH